ncbi:MAG: hypothetical protein OIF51_08880 [Cellvibrionaceae bacterium]|nr:hypothetical protein [Cellvibrionaceae bacterium]
MNSLIQTVDCIHWSHTLEGVRLIHEIETEPKLEFGVKFFDSLLEAWRKAAKLSVRASLPHAVDFCVRHEIAHLNLGHLKLLEDQSTFNLISKRCHSYEAYDEFPRIERGMIERCLELQADHEAIDEMVGSFLLNGDWVTLRVKIVSIAAVMVLIETVDAINPAASISHPKAATRIFQCLGHMSELWAISASLKADALLPSEEIIQQFSKEVVLPAYHDAVKLAQSTGAQEIVADLGEPADFFGDIARAKLGQLGELKTVGAREWAELKGANELLLPLVVKFQSQQSSLD